MKKIYETEVVEHGPLAEAFLGEKMIVLFNDNAPAELAEFCVLHSGNDLIEEIEIGDILRINGTDYDILKVGSEVQKNLGNLGHISLNFKDCDDEDVLEGGLYLEDKEVSLPKVGTKIEIYKR